MQIKHSLFGYIDILCVYMCYFMCVCVCIDQTVVDKIDKQIKPKFIYWKPNNRNNSLVNRFFEFLGDLTHNNNTTTKRKHGKPKHWNTEALKRARIRSSKLQTFLCFLWIDLKKYFCEAISKHKAKPNESERNIEKLPKHAYTQIAKEKR